MRIVLCFRCLVKFILFSPKMLFLYVRCFACSDFCEPIAVSETDQVISFIQIRKAGLGDMNKDMAEAGLLPRSVVHCSSAHAGCVQYISRCALMYSV